MTVAFGNRGGAVNFGHPRPLGKRRIIRTQPHGAAFVVACITLDGPVALDPFFQVIHDRRKPFFARFMIKFFRSSVLDTCQISRSLDHGHLHTKANPEVRNVVLARILRRLDLALGATLAKAAGD